MTSACWQTREELPTNTVLHGAVATLLVGMTLKIGRLRFVVELAARDAVPSVLARIALPRTSVCDAAACETQLATENGAISLFSVRARPSCSWIGLPLLVWTMQG